MSNRSTVFGKLLQHHHLNYAGMFCDELASHFFINQADLILMAFLKKMQTAVIFCFTEGKRDSAYMLTGAAANIYCQ